MVSEREALQAICRSSFAAFAAKAFQIVEPGIKLEWNWHLDLICEHLQALHEDRLPDGKRRLCINVPPRTLKSFLTSIAFPAWVMGNDPTKKYISTSFKFPLAKTMAQKSRILMESEWYLDTFPKTRIDDRQNEKHNFWTTERGFYYSSALLSVTGTGGDYCFIKDTKVLTSSGYKNIQDIKVNDLVWSYNHDGRIAEIQRVDKIFSRSVSSLVQVQTVGGRRIVCTPEHRFWTENRGYVPAQNLTALDKLVTGGLSACADNQLHTSMRFLPEGVYAQEGGLSEVIEKKARRLLLFKSLFKRSSQYQKPQVMRGMWGQDRKQESKVLPTVSVQIIHSCFSFLREAVLRYTALDRVPGWLRMRLLPVQEEVAGSSHRREQTKQSSAQPAVSVSNLSPEAPSGEFDFIRSVEPYGNGTHTVYDIAVAGNHNFYAEGILVHNCGLDDPINPQEALSDTVRVDTNGTISNTIPTRFNDLRTAKWLMIMQRLHEDDPSGHFAINDPRWFVVKLPGENLTGKDIVYTLGDKTWTYKAGELLFPQRLTRQVLNELREDLGDYNYAGQILQEPVPLGGGVFREEWFNFYQQGGIKPKEMNIVILCDPSGGEEVNKKKKKLSDWSAFIVIGLAPDNNYYILDIVRDRLNPTERVDTLFMLHKKWNTLSGKSPKVGYEKYGMMTDTHYIRDKQRDDAYNFALVELGGSMSKVERIMRLVPDVQKGRWFLPATLPYVDNEGRKWDLVHELLHTEVPTFPRARFDDMLDAWSRVYESELFMTFPKPRASMTQKAMSAGGARADDSWENW